MKTLIANFLKGCLVIVPIACTAYVLYLLFTSVDGLLGYPIPGVGFLATVAIVTVVGALTSNVIGRRVLRQAERLLARVPLVKLLYTSIRDFVGAFVGDHKSFDRPVVVSLDADAKLLGFATSEQLEHLGLAGYVAVYLPQSYNFAGNLVLFPAERVRPVETDSAAFMAFVVSGGVVAKQPSADATG